MKTKIEWCDATINPVKGLCPVACPFCYARRLYKRFKWNPEIRFDPLILTEPFCYSRPSRVFVGSTMELFGDWVKPAWIEMIFEFCQRETNKRHTFIFLTKQPQNLIKWSPFPENCWVGVSVTSNGSMTNAYYGLSSVKAGKRFISFEPLLGSIGMDDHVNIKNYLDWLIIGQQTPVRKSTMPRIEWIREIVEAADKAGIPIFLKDNLESALCFDSKFYNQVETETGPEYKLRQEFPKC